MIIDGLRKDGSRVSISIDDVIWKLWELDKGEKAKKLIKEQMQQDVIVNSKSGRTYIMLQIVKPSLAKKYLLGEQVEDQIDIEDV